MTEHVKSHRVLLFKWARRVVCEAEPRKPATEGQATSAALRESCLEVGGL